LRLDFFVGVKICFSSRKCLDQLWVLPNLLFSGTRGTFPGLKRAGHTAKQSLPSTAEVKNERSYTSNAFMLFTGTTFLLPDIWSTPYKPEYKASSQHPLPHPQTAVHKSRCHLTSEPLWHFYSKISGTEFFLEVPQLDRQSCLLLELTQHLLSVNIPTLNVTMNVPKEPISSDTFYRKSTESVILHKEFMVPQRLWNTDLQWGKIWTFIHEAKQIAPQLIFSSYSCEFRKSTVSNRNTINMTSVYNNDELRYPLF
jgi:hypothetical protein